MEGKKDLIVELKERQPLVAISRRTITSMSNIGSVIGKVFEDIFNMNLKAEGPVMTVYHDKHEFDIENVDCEICIPVNSRANAEKNENIKEFSGGLVASITFVGPYSRLGEAYAKIVKWIEDNGYEYAGAPFDIYLNGPQTAKSSDEFVTEVCFPVSK